MTSPSSPTLVDGRVECAICGFKSHSLWNHLAQQHHLTPTGYIEKYDAPVIAAAVQQKLSEGVRRKSVVEATELCFDAMGFNIPVDPTVDELSCLPMPEAWHWPTRGKAKQVFLRIVRAFHFNRNMFIWGMPGTGKDAIIHALSYLSRRPAIMVSFKPGHDISSMFYSRSITGGDTGWDFGQVFDIIVNGVEARDGTMRPAIVLLSDVDRADTAQAEWFRMLTDSISGRVQGPDGKVYKLFPGTVFICTANSCGSGDSRGRMASANPIDASILDRLGRKIHSAYLDWEDEKTILMNKFPLLAEVAPHLFEGEVNHEGKKGMGELGSACKSIRKAIENEEIYGEFTHRGICEVLSECNDIMVASRRTSPPKNLLSQGFKAWLEGLEPEDALSAKRLIDPHIGGGGLVEEDEEIDSDEEASW